MGRACCDATARGNARHCDVAASRQAGCATRDATKGILVAIEARRGSVESGISSAELGINSSEYCINSAESCISSADPCASSEE